MVGVGGSSPLGRTKNLKGPLIAGLFCFCAAILRGYSAEEIAVLNSALASALPLLSR